MERRKFLVGVGGVAAGGAALLGTGAFSRVESQRAVTIQVAEDPDAYLGLKPLDTPNSQNYVALDENGHLYVQIDGEGDQQDVGSDGPIGQGVNSDSRTWFDGLFKICNQGKEDACVSWEFGDDFEMRDDAELVFYYDGDEDGDPSTSGRVDVEEGREVPLALGECARIGLRTETFDVDATEEGPLFDGDIQLIADVDGDCFVEEPPDPDPEPCPEEMTWDEIGDTDEAGGPVILMGLDSEWGAGDDDHGSPEEHADMVENGILNNVTNDGEGILVLGGADGHVEDYWQEDVGDRVGEDVTFVLEPEDIREANFDGYAMIGVATDDIYSQSGSGVTDARNDAIIDRSGDIAAFVNEGGGLLGKTQETLSEPWGYVDPFGDFDPNTAANFVEVIVEQPGLDLGLTQDGMSGWCCWHETFTDFPDFFEVLVTNDESGDPGFEEAAAIGGEQVIIEREVSLEITGLDTIEVNEQECYDVEVENQGTETIEDAEFEVEVVSGTGVVTDTLPDTVTLEPGVTESWDDAICVGCEIGGSTEVSVELVGGDGVRLVDVTMDLDCVDEVPDEC